MSPISTPLLASYDVIVINSSGGKDSQAMLDVVATHAHDVGVLDRVTVVHNDLGETDEGRPVEWPGTADSELGHHFRADLSITDILNPPHPALW